RERGQARRLPLNSLPTSCAWFSSLPAGLPGGDRRLDPAHYSLLDHRVVRKLPWKETFGAARAVSKT
ncbi:unnamed protein product, partial [Ectocarpus sp. 4 AP-2014]